MRWRLLWIIVIPIFVLIAFGLGSGTQVMLESFQAPPRVNLAQRFYSASERQLWERFVDDPPPSFEEKVEPNFPELLRAALGYGILGDPAIRSQRYPHPIDNSIRELRIAFSKPELTFRALYWRHGKADTLVVVLHGFASTADKVFGFDKPDYMQFVGGRLFNDGLDVLAFGMPSDPVLASAMNSRLTWHGTTVEGAWSHAVCETMGALRDRHGYKRVIVYGVREGGRYADIMSVLCEPVTRVVVDGSVLDRRRAIWRDAQHQQMKQPILFDQLVPIEGRTSISDFLAHSRSPKVYLAGSFVLDEIEPRLREKFEQTHVNGSRYAFVVKKRSRSVPELPDILRLLRDGADGFDGFGVRLKKRLEE